MPGNINPPSTPPSAGHPAINNLIIARDTTIHRLYSIDAPNGTQLDVTDWVFSWVITNVKGLHPISGEASVITDPRDPLGKLVQIYLPWNALTGTALEPHQNNLLHKLSYTRPDPGRTEPFKGIVWTGSLKIQ
jgi:hypothetical protein